MRLFFTSVLWCLNFLLFKIVFLGNRKILPRFEQSLFKVVPLKPVHSIHSQVVLYITAEFEIPGTTGSSYMLQYARSSKIYSGDVTANKRDLIIVPIRIYCPLRSSKVYVCGNYNTRWDTASVRHYTTQEFQNVKPGWFDGVLFLNQNDTEVHS